MASEAARSTFSLKPDEQFCCDSAVMPPSRFSEIRRNIPNTTQQREILRFNSSFGPKAIAIGVQKWSIVHVMTTAGRARDIPTFDHMTGARALSDDAKERLRVARQPATKPASAL